MTSLERALSTLKEQIDETVPRTVRDGGATENRLRDLRAQNGRELPRNRLYGARRKPRERGESWRRGRDSNPRYGFPHTHFPGVRLQPLGHPSCRVHGMDAKRGA